MRRNKMTAVLTGTALCVGMLSGAVNVCAEEPNPAEAITEGYYMYSYQVEGLGDMYNYFHFYEEQPVLGSVFYAGFCMDQITFAGTYTVEEKEFEYTCWADRAEQEAAGDGAEVPAGTAPYTITFYDFDGNEMDSCGFDGDVLYNDMETITGVGAGNQSYYHDTEGEASQYADYYTGEVGIHYADFVAADTETSTLALFHNGRYQDLVNMLVEGSWTMAETDEGYDFTLTPDYETDIPAVLSVTSDFSSATYTPDEGDAVEMVNAAGAAKEVFQVMKGVMDIPGQDGVTADVILNMYTDNTCDVTASAFGTDMPLDEGTYTVGEDGFTITFAFDKAGELVSELDGAPVLQYVQNGTENLGDVDVKLSMGEE